MARIMATIGAHEFLVSMSKQELSLLAGWSKWSQQQPDWKVGDEFRPADMYAQLEAIADHRGDIESTVTKLRKMADNLQGCIDIKVISTDLKEATRR